MIHNIKWKAKPGKKVFRILSAIFTENASTTKKTSAATNANTTASPIEISGLGIKTANTKKTPTKAVIIPANNPSNDLFGNLPKLLNLCFPNALPTTEATPSAKQDTIEVPTMILMGENMKRNIVNKKGTAELIEYASLFGSKEI